MDTTAIDTPHPIPDPTGPDAPGSVARRLLDWYDRSRRRLPWRSDPGHRPDPYHIWLSEIMLQQTTVATVGPYFQRFLEKWPTVDALASAPLDDVLHAWAGLGYYARARNLHKCARTVSVVYGGMFPETEEDLLTLPGIGRYTAAAVAAIAFGRRAVVVDGNVERVMARLFSVMQPLPDWRISPYLTLGVGQIETDPNSSLISQNDDTNTFAQYGLGMQAYVTRSFLARFEINEYVIFSSTATRDDNEVVNEWKFGFAVFF